MKFSGFKVPKHRKFGYIPRHYDPEKEELEKRIKRYQADVSDEEMLKERISHGFRQTYVGDPEYRKKLVKKSNMRLFLIILTLIILGLIVLGTGKITQMVHWFEG